jgi:tetratricopeptide (TPR) repeat protein
VLARFVGLVVGNMQLSPHLVTMTTVGLLSLLPAVILLAFFAGRRPGGAWGRPEKIGVPVNVVAAVGLLLVLFSGKDLGAAMKKVEVTNEEGETIERVIPKGSFRKNFALYVFENKSGDEELDWMQFALPLMLEYDIYQDAFISVGGAFDENNWQRLKESGFDSWVGVPDALKRKIAAERHESQYVSGEIDRQGDVYAITVRVHETDSGKLLEEKVYRGTDIFAMTDEIAVDLKRATGVPSWHLDGVQDLTIASMVTDSPEAMREHALALKAMVFDRDWPAVARHLDASLAADSTNALAHFHRWQAARVSNDAGGGQSALQASLRHAYKVPERFQFIIKGNYYFMQQEPDKALALFEMMRELYPEDIQAFLALAQVYRIRNEIDNAIAAYEKIIELDPYQHEHLHEIATLCKRRGYYDRALDYLERYADMNPQNSKSFEEIAELNRDMGEFEKARQNLDKALLIDPERVTLLIGAANADLNMGKFDEAFEQYRDALRASRSSTDSARVYNALEDYCEMRGEYRSSIDFMKKRQENISVPLMRVIQELDEVDRYVHAGDTDAAFAAMKRIEGALTAPPYNLAIPFGYVEIYRALKKPDELQDAIEGFEKYIAAFKLEALRPRVDYARGYAAELRGEYNTAIGFYIRIIEEDPGSAGAFRAVGRCQREMGQLDDAKANLQRSLKLRPYDAEANHLLALVYHARGDMQNARKHLDRCLTTWANADPAYEEAARARATRDEWDAATNM